MFFDEPVKSKTKLEKTPVEIDRNFDLSEDFASLDLYTDAELQKAIFSTLILDIECYSNYFLVMFKNFETKKVIYFEMSPDSTIDKNKLQWIMWNFLTVGFNSFGYDLPMLFLCLKGLDVTQLKRVSDRIVAEELRPRAIENEFGIKIPEKINHVDLIEVAPLSASLKTYAGRLHCQKMQDLPFDPHKPLTQKQAKSILHYCINDVDNTALLFSELAEQIKLRCDMSEFYGIDLRSRSDAQIAEHVLASEVAKINHNWPRRPVILEGQTYHWTPPEWLDAALPRAKALGDTIAAIPFTLGANGAIQMPEELNKQTINIGNGVYRLGIGGLHSSEEKVCHKADEEYLLLDRDVSSFYPSIILNQGLFPKQMGKAFLEVYGGLVEKRLKAKAIKDKVKADSLKISINGSFGKLGSKYSCLYSPDLLLQVTMSGQIALLMLIEFIESVDIEIVSANTDGIIIKCPESRYDELTSIIKYWENKTAFNTEETRYKAVYSRDVNNYIAIKEDNSIKVKGTYSEKGSALNSVLSKNPEKLICADAVVKLLTEGVSIADTILNCKDIRRFVVVRNVKGGAHKNGKYLGKVVRWVYLTDSFGEISYVNTGNKVPNSENSTPLMDLPKIFPNNINYEKYIKDCEQMLVDIGYSKPEQKGLW